MRPVRAMMAVGLVLAVCGCGGGDEEVAANAANAANAVPEITRGPMLGGVDLSRTVIGQGREGWSLRIAPGYLGFTAREGVEADQYYFVAPAMGEGSAVYTTTDIPGEKVTILLKAERCTLGKAETAYPLTLTLTVGKRTRNGCARQAG